MSTGAAAFYFKLTEVVDGLQTMNEGSTVRPVKEFATSGLRRERSRTLVVTPGSSIMLWRYLASSGGTGTGFDLMTLVADGYLDVAWKCDKPTDADDRTAMGTHVVWNHQGLSCNAPLVFPGDDVLVLATASGTDYDTVGFPTGADAAYGKIYEVWVKNPSTATENVSVSLTWVD